MALSPDSWGLRSPIVEVHFAGWRSDTLALQGAGWKLAMEQDAYRGTINLLLHHRELNLTGIAEPWGNRPHYIEMRDLQRDRVPFVVRTMRIGMEMRNPITVMPFANHTLIDAEPSFTEFTNTTLRSLPLFAELDQPRAEELIVEPADVSALLDQIKRMQAPRMKEIRANEAYRDRCAPPDNVRQFHASIITLKAA